MKPRMNSCVLFASAMLPILCGLSMPAEAQRGAPAADSAKKAPPPPRLPNGRVDFTGVWYVGAQQLDARASRRGLKFDPGTQEAPSFQPWVFEKRKLMGKTGEISLSVECHPLGAVRMFETGGYPLQLISSADGKKVVLLTEMQTTYRIIHTDRSSVRKDGGPFYNGNAVGHWEGDTLVADVTDLDWHVWLPGARAWFPSDVMRLTERLQRPDLNTFIYQVTIEDPKVLTKPWTSAPMKWVLGNDDHFFEYYCSNNQQYSEQDAGEPILTPSGEDERFFDQEEYERLTNQAPKASR